ncbi:hypothetical protein J5N97_019891 [Dioscorea zingiberensis]|uniref:Uncharacterized protein n=1 Tax=Dioscorea zingiberensis TaxID=325984 RepID=A0A9D5CEQ5_9LILI|nr:hypothetical protein J5N97_019891 [Dioscorea zingiberensis]
MRAEANRPKGIVIGEPKQRLPEHRPDSKELPTEHQVTSKQVLRSSPRPAIVPGGEDPKTAEVTHPTMMGPDSVPVPTHVAKLGTESNKAWFEVVEVDADVDVDADVTSQKATGLGPFMKAAWHSKRTQIGRLDRFGSPDNLGPPLPVPASTNPTPARALTMSSGGRGGPRTPTCETCVTSQHSTPPAQSTPTQPQLAGDPVHIAPHKGTGPKKPTLSNSSQTDVTHLTKKRLTHPTKTVDPISIDSTKLARNPRSSNTVVPFTNTTANQTTNPNPNIAPDPVTLTTDQLARISDEDIEVDPIPNQGMNPSGTPVTQLNQDPNQDIAQLQVNPLGSNVIDKALSQSKSPLRTSNYIKVYVTPSEENLKILNEGIMIDLNNTTLKKIGNSWNLITEEAWKTITSEQWERVPPEKTIPHGEEREDRGKQVMVNPQDEQVPPRQRGRPRKDKTTEPTIIRNKQKPGTKTLRTTRNGKQRTEADDFPTLTTVPITFAHWPAENIIADALKVGVDLDIAEGNAEQIIRHLRLKDAERSTEGQGGN